MTTLVYEDTATFFKRNNCFCKPSRMSTQQIQTNSAFTVHEHTNNMPSQQNVTNTKHGYTRDMKTIHEEYNRLHYT